METDFLIQKCPFCGSEARCSYSVRDNSDAEYLGHSRKTLYFYKVRVNCINEKRCGATISLREETSEFKPEEFIKTPEIQSLCAQAIALWNLRVHKKE